MAYLIRYQHARELLQHLGFHMVQIVLQLIRLISQCRQQQREDGILLDALQLVRMVTTAPNADSLLHQLLGPLFVFKYRLFHASFFLFISKHARCS